MKLVSLVVPVFNEEAVVDEFIRVTSDVLRRLPVGIDYEVIFIDDGSIDQTHSILSEYSKHDHRIRLVAFSRNFGHQAAIAAGLRNATGDAVITIDCDLQDPPELILEFVSRWIKGADVVLGRRVDRTSDRWMKRISARMFYKIMSRLSSSQIEPEVADFRLISRNVVEVLLRLEESNPFWRGLVQWVGFNPEFVEYIRMPRVAGSTKYSMKKMFKLGLSGVTSFSDRPLIGVSVCGLLITGLTGAYSIWVLVSKIIWPDRSVPGYITAILLTLFLSGVQLLVLGLIGVYVSAVNRNVRQRPEFVVWSDKCRNINISRSSAEVRTHHEFRLSEPDSKRPELEEVKSRNHQEF